MTGSDGPVIVNNFFTCRETPLRITTEDYNAIKSEGTCATCKVRFTSLLPTLGTLTPSPYGLTFDIPQMTLEVNGVRHSGFGCVLDVSGSVHALDISGVISTVGSTNTAELHLTFHGDGATTRNSKYVLAIPIRVVANANANKLVGANFFAALGILQRTRPTLGSVISEDTPLLMYRGVSLEGVCGSNSDAGEKYTYLVALKSLTMDQTDFNRLKVLLGNTYKGLRKSAINLASNRRPLVSYIPGIKVTASPLAPSVKKTIQNGYVATEQVKCRPLDSARDISGNLVYVGGPGKYSTLKNELEMAADLRSEFEEAEATADVSRIETILAIVVGVLVGLFITSLIVYYVFIKTESGYSKMSLLYAVARLKDNKAVANAVDAAKGVATAATKGAATAVAATAAAP